MRFERHPGPTADRCFRQWGSTGPRGEGGASTGASAASGKAGLRFPHFVPVIALTVPTQLPEGAVSPAGKTRNVYEEQERSPSAHTVKPRAASGAPVQRESLSPACPLSPSRAAPRDSSHALPEQWPVYCLSGPWNASSPRQALAFWSPC